MMKKIMGFVFVLCAVMSLAVCVRAAEIVDSGECGVNGSNLTWTLDSIGTLTISGEGEMKDYNYEDVSPFYHNPDIKSVIIKNGVTSIGKEAFSRSYLTSIVIPESITSIGDHAFYECISLDSLYISNLAAYLNINFNDTGSNPMSRANNLYINNRQITGDITIPNDATKIPSYAFNGCDGITSVTIPGSVKAIDYRAFENCTGLNDIIIGNGVTSIGDGAFKDCTSLKSVTIPESVTAIVDVNYMLGVSSAFAGCTSLTNINVSENNTNYSSADGSLFNKDKTRLIQYAIGKKNTEYKIPDGVTEIDWEAFRQCASLKNIAIPDSVKEIDFSAFFDCDGLTSVTIPYGVTSIGSNSFRNCGSLKTVVIPDTVESIGLSAFSDCESLTDVYYGGSKEKLESILDWNNEDWTTESIIHYNSDIAKHTPAPTLIPVTTAEIVRTDAETDAAYSFEVDAADKYENCYVYAAVYDADGALLAVKRVPLETADETVVSVNKNENDAEAKVFIWADNTQPIITAEKFILK